MVKKIKANDEETKAEKLEKEATAEFRDEVRDWMQRVDWKMWELLKVVQAYAERDGLVSEEESDDTVYETDEDGVEIATEESIKFVPIMVDEDEE